MRKITIFDRSVAVVATALLCMTASAQNLKLQLEKSNKTEINGRKTIKALPVNSSASDSRSGLTSRKSWSDGSTTEDILLDEDFSAFTWGTTDNPDTTRELATEYGSNEDYYINPSLVNQSGWCGTSVYPAGGACALLDPYGYIGAALNTPLGDYSGDLTITFKAKGLSKSDMLLVNVLKNGYTNPAFAGEGTRKQYNFYKGQGWTKVTMKVTNTCAQNDGFIQFLSYGMTVIDDIQVTSTSNFIANPTIEPITNFQKHQFTANWQKVRKASNYYLNLYKLNYTSDKDSTITENFENVNADASNLTGWKYVSSSANKISATEGADNTKGIILQNGDTLTTPDGYAKYRNANLWMRVYAPGASEEDLYNAVINISAKTMSGWKNLGDYYAAYLTDGSKVDMQSATGKAFKDKYYGLRITASGLPKGGYLVLDNFSIDEGPQAKLDTLYDENLSYPGIFYDTTKKLQYTFMNLDSLGEYYYSVRSHYMMMYSDETLQPAFGVSAPDVIAATDVDQRGGYTANWDAAPKATRYTVTNYGVYVAPANEEKHAVLDEDFSKVTSDVTTATDPYAAEAVGNTKETSLDDYTKLPGWVSQETSLAQGMIGCGTDEDHLPYIRTPKLYLLNDSLYYLTIKAYGSVGDYLRVRTTTYDYDYLLPFTDSGDGKKGVIDNTFIIPERGNYTIRFSSYASKNFTMDNIKVMQNIKAGDKVYTPLTSVTVGADTLSYRFTGLDKYGYDIYAYNVLSYLDSDDGSVATSDPSAYQLVILDPTSIASVNEVKDVREVARYSADGMRLSAPVKGINIVKLSNGKTLKVVVR